MKLCVTRGKSTSCLSGMGKHFRPASIPYPSCLIRVPLSQCLLNYKMHSRGYNSKMYKYLQLARPKFLQPNGYTEVSSCTHLSTLDRLSPSSYREAAAMGTPRPRNRSRTAGTSGYSWMLWPRLSRTVPSLERARVRSGPAEPRLAPGLPSPASPALVERGVYVRVHPERPERVICERKKVGVSQPARAQGLESSYWGLEKYGALRNFPQSGPSPRSNTASFGSRAMTRARRLCAGRQALRSQLSGRRRASEKRRLERRQPSWEGRSQDHTRAPSGGGGGEGPQQSTVADSSHDPRVSLRSLPLFLHPTQPHHILLN